MTHSDHIGLMRLVSALPDVSLNVRSTFVITQIDIAQYFQKTPTRHLIVHATNHFTWNVIQIQQCHYSFQITTIGNRIKIEWKLNRIGIIFSYLIKE